MKIAVLFYIDEGVSENALLCAGQPVSEQVAKKLERINGIDKILYSVPQTYHGTLTGSENSAARKGKDDIQFWKGLFADSKADHIIKILADAPFIDASIIQEMLEVHLENLAEFTFSENLPAGLGCEIMSKELVESIPDFGEETLPVSQVVRSNINQFDIELYYKEPDLRDKRLSFLSRYERDKKIMENIERQHNGIPGYPEIKGLIDNNPELLYIGPSYVEIELTGRCDLDCIFCFRKFLTETHPDMKAELAAKILADMRAFQLPYTICLGGSGEPLLHENFYAILDTMVREPLVERIIIETNGILADANYKQAIEKHEKIITIVNMNGHTSELYKSLHISDCFEAVLGNLRLLRELNSKTDRVYAQIMKINETEAFLDEYYNFFEQEKIPIILQKQNVYLGKIADRRYSDLSPLERTPCCHLQRDLYVLANGTIAFCKQDVDGEHALGNILETSLEKLWEQKKTNFIDDYTGKLSTAPRCKECDEWYTFNF